MKKLLWPTVLCLAACNDDFLANTDTADVSEQVEAILALSGEVASGKSSYDVHCSGCHTEDGSPAFGTSLVESVPLLNDEDLLTVILAGQGQMPAIALGDQEGADLLAWLRATYPGDDSLQGDTDDDTGS